MVLAFVLAQNDIPRNQPGIGKCLVGVTNMCGDYQPYKEKPARLATFHDGSSTCTHPDGKCTKEMGMPFSQHSTENSPAKSRAVL